MAIDEAGHDATARKIDHARPRRDVGRDGFVRADRQDAISGDRQGLGDGKGAIDGNDLA